MARKKVNLAWIQNDANRRSTLKKRRMGLLKKISELSTLCDVKACAVIYEPNEVQPEVWPSEAEAKIILQRFKAMPEMDQCQKMVDQEGFLRQGVSKLEEQVKRQRRENREMEMHIMMGQGTSGRSLREVGVEEASALRRLFEEKLNAVREKIEEKEKCQGWIVEFNNPNPNPEVNLMEQGVFGVYRGSGGLEDMMNACISFPKVNLREQGIFGVYRGGGGLEDMMNACISFPEVNLVEQGIFGVYRGGGGLEDMMNPCINFEGQSSFHPLVDF